VVVFGSAVLDTIIGLTLVYFLLSTITSHLSEILSGVMNWRATQLEKGIRTLLGGGAAGDGALADRVLSNALIQGLRGTDNRKLPSYIPSSTFALALFDTLVPDEPGTVDGSGSTEIDRLQKAINDLPPGSVRDALRRIVISARSDIATARTDVEAWYNAAMDRVTGVYKRRIQWVVLGIGAAVTVFLGVDTIAIATVLSQEQGVRAAVSGAAQGSGGTGLEDALNTLSQLNLPLGWGFPPRTAFGWFLKAVGLLVTALAVSLGAPFWFDLFKLFTNPRQTGPPPSTAITNGRGQSAASPKGGASSGPVGDAQSGPAAP
jgi:hypothetical protein